MKSLVKKTKKNVTSLNGTSIASKPVDFIAAYQRWKGAMGEVSGESIFSPDDLFKTVEKHVNSSVRRGKSKNTGKDGAGVEVVGKIEKLILEGKKLFFEKDIEVLEEYATTLEGFLKSENLNPQNVYFTRPTKWEPNSKGTRIIVTDDTEVEYYGHYIDGAGYFKATQEAKNKRKKGLGKKTDGFKDSWSSEKKNTAKPPLYLALYGKEGDDYGIGLLPLIQKAIEELKNQDHVVTINRLRQANKLARIPEIRKVVSGLLRRKALFTGGDFNTNLAASQLKTMPINLNEQSADKLSTILYGAKLAGDLEQVVFDLDKKSMKRLIEMAVVSRTSELKDKKSPTGEPIILKRWQDYLWS